MVKFTFQAAEREKAITALDLSKGCRGLVSVGSLGAHAPADFRIALIGT